MDLLKNIIPIKQKNIFFVKLAAICLVLDVCHKPVDKTLQQNVNEHAINIYIRTLITSWEDNTYFITIVLCLTTGTAKLTEALLVP